MTMPPVRKILPLLLAALLALPAAAGARRQRGDERNALKSYYTPDYLSFKKRIMGEFARDKAGKFSEFIKYAHRKKQPVEEQKVIAFTFDACGGRHSGYNAKLIEYLRREKIPATLFVTGIWIDKNRETFEQLAKDPLFEIENHGLMHRLCSTEGRSKYGVYPTRDLGDVIDEMELGARKIALITGRRPLFFRSATAYTDELSLKVAQRIGMEVVSYDVLSGDAMRQSAKKMSRNILAGARHGAVVIMHFNHPEWPDLEALELAVPELRKRGFTFARLEDFTVKP
jgi:peptidoglycan/xylan/chitin deacetylase (PgdA/CDA1 family)